MSCCFRIYHYAVTFVKLEILKMKNNLSNYKVQPFLKWAGGKRWLLRNENVKFPSSYNRYIEAFVGSASLFFTLSPKRGILSDKNPWLIDTYKAIKKDWKKVFGYLKVHALKHNCDYYYSIRNQKSKNIYTKAAKLIYLNRTCWNGLFRVNLKGEFNVPKGTKDKVILESDNFELVSKKLKNIKLFDYDFEKVINMAREGDFLFIDPPYTVRHDNNGFVKYNKHLFSWDDQERLYESLVRAVSKGAKVMATNAHHPSILKLYKEKFKTITLQRYSVISGKNAARSKCKEYLITEGF